MAPSMVPLFVTLASLAPISVPSLVTVPGPPGIQTP